MSLELTFNVYSWLKLQYILNRDDNEVSAMAITDKDNPLYITDLAIIKQEVSGCTTEMDDDALAEFMETMFEEEGISPVNCMRIWVHTHPGSSCSPSATDEATFKKAFGSCDWAIMFIISETGSTFCRLRTKVVGATANLTVPVKVDWTNLDGLESNKKEWEEEVLENVTEKVFMVPTGQHPFVYEDMLGGYGGYYQGDSEEKYPWYKQVMKKHKR